jgi:hypothetical protein
MAAVRAALAATAPPKIEPVTAAVAAHPAPAIDPVAAVHAAVNAAVAAHPAPAIDPVAAVNAAVAATRAPAIDPVAAVHAAVAATPAPAPALPRSSGFNPVTAARAEVARGGPDGRRWIRGVLDRASDPSWSPAQPVRVSGVLMVGVLIDLLLTFLKWPIAVAAVVLLPGAAMTLWEGLRVVAAHPGPIWYFLVGAAGYVLLFQVVLTRITRFGSYLSTFEHELTHAIVALVTVHKIRDFKVTRRAGGHVQVLGGNWVISIAPYFVPTLSILLMFAMHFLPPAALQWADLALGASVGYHFLSTMRETHRSQPDLQRTGRGFALLFLPTANLIMYGLVIAFAHRGTAGIGDQLRAIWTHTCHLAGR